MKKQVSNQSQTRPQSQSRALVPFKGQNQQAQQARQQSRQNQRRQQPRQTIPRAQRQNPSTDQIGAVVRTRLTRVGMSDIRSHRVSWVMGYTYVGNGTNGIANSVYFQTASSNYLITGFVATTSSGQVPIAASDFDLGQVYVSDVEKHFARKVVKRMWIHVDSLQPSTSNNMMAIIGVSRGPGGTAFSLPNSLLATQVANTVANVSSMKASFPVDSWEHKTVEITQFIAGGSGPKQNEFEIQGSPANASIYPGAGSKPAIDADSLIPACIAVAGNCTTAALQNTKVHQITIEQEVDLLDYVGGMAQVVATD